MKYIRPQLQNFLLAELPTLIVTLALLAWAIAAMSDARNYANKSGRWEQGMSSTTYLTTSTGLSPLYTAVPFTTTAPSVTVSDGSRSTSSYTRTTSSLSYYTTSFGTYTQTRVSVSVSYKDPPAEYTSLHPSTAGAPQVTARALPVKRDISRREECKRVGCERGDRLGQQQQQRAINLQLAKTPPLIRRFASWGDGYSNRSMDDGLYQAYSDAGSDLSIYIGFLGACLFAVALRILATLIYFIVGFLFTRNDDGNNNNKDSRKSFGVAQHMAKLLLGIAVVSFAILVACGIAGWIYFADYQDLEAADVRATMAFWVITCLTSFVAIVLAAISVHRLSRLRKNVSFWEDSEEEPK